MISWATCKILGKLTAFTSTGETWTHSVIRGCTSTSKWTRKEVYPLGISSSAWMHKLHQQSKGIIPHFTSLVNRALPGFESLDSETCGVCATVRARTTPVLGTWLIENYRAQTIPRTYISLFPPIPFSFRTYSIRICLQKLTESRIFTNAAFFISTRWHIALTRYTENMALLSLEDVWLVFSSALAKASWGWASGLRVCLMDIFFLFSGYF